MHLRMRMSSVHTGLMASFQESLGELVWKCQTIVDFATAGDDGKLRLQQLQL